MPSSQAGPTGSVAEAGEFGVIRAITSAVTVPPGVDVGPGDDAAVLTAPDGRIVVSTDMLVEGVHFRTDWVTGDQIGRRAALAAMADICAMGAMPTGLVVAFGAPSDTPASLVTDIASGLSAAAAELGSGLIGGDLTRAESITISVTVLGDLRGGSPILRSGAHAGDILALAGRVGWSAAGFDVLSRGFRSPAAVVGAYKVPEPPLAPGPLAAAAGATAMLDVSDGLLADVGHIARASGVSIDIRTERLPVPPRLAEVASALGKDPLAWLLTGGEDHALAATFPPGADLPAPFEPIGTVGIAATDTRDIGAEEDALRGAAVTVDGSPYDGDAGWEHFR